MNKPTDNAGATKRRGLVPFGALGLRRSKMTSVLTAQRRREAEHHCHRANGQARALSLAPAIAAVAVFLVAPSTSAGDEPALAETLYQDGRNLMIHGRTAEACAKFEESLRLDLATGTLLNLAACHQTLGKIATAWAEFRTAAASAEHDRREDRVRFAQDHLDQIEPRLSRLTIAVSEGARVSGLRITLDGTVIGPAAWNVATPIDPGSHVVGAGAAGYNPMLQTLTVGATAGKFEVVVALAPSSGTAVSKRAVLFNDSAMSQEQTDQRVGWLSPANNAAYATAGVGVAALVVGGAFGIRAISKWSHRNQECPMDACTEAGIRYSSEAETAALAADIAVGVGVVGLALGGYLLFRSHARSSAAASKSGARGPNLHLSSLSATARGAAIGLDW